MQLHSSYTQYSWQVQYLMKLHSSCSVFVAGAIFGAVQLSLFKAGAVLGDIWNESPSAKCYIFRRKVRAM